MGKLCLIEGEPVEATIQVGLDEQSRNEIMKAGFSAEEH